MPEDSTFHGDLVDSKAHGLPRSVRYSPSQLAMVAKLVESKEIPQLSDFSSVQRDCLYRGLKYYETLIKNPEFKQEFASLRRRVANEARASAEAMECKQAEHMVEAYVVLFQNTTDQQSKERLRKEVQELCLDYSSYARNVLLKGLTLYL